MKRYPVSRHLCLEMSVLSLSLLLLLLHGDVDVLQCAARHDTATKQDIEKHYFDWSALGVRAAEAEKAKSFKNLMEKFIISVIESSQSVSQDKEFVRSLKLAATVIDSKLVSYTGGKSSLLSNVWSLKYFLPPVGSIIRNFSELFDLNQVSL